MRKAFWLLFVALLLVACSAAETIDQANTADENAVAAPTAAVEEETQPADTETAGEGVEAAPDEAEAAGAETAITPEEAGVIRERDWSKGAEDPAVTIIEYGDFQ